MADKRLDQVEELQSFDKVLGVKGDKVGGITANTLKQWGGVFTVNKKESGNAVRLAKKSDWFSHYAALIYVLAPASGKGTLIAITWVTSIAPTIKVLSGETNINNFGIYYDTGRENSAEHELWFKFENKQVTDGTFCEHILFSSTMNDHLQQADVPDGLTKATIQ